MKMMKMMGMTKPAKPPSRSGRREPQRSSIVLLSHGPSAPSARTRSWRSKPLVLRRVSKFPRYSAAPPPAAPSPLMVNHRNPIPVKVTRDHSEKRKAQRASRGAGRLLARSISTRASRSGLRHRMTERRRRNWRGRRKVRRGRVYWGCWRRGALVRRERVIVFWEA